MMPNRPSKNVGVTAKYELAQRRREALAGSLARKTAASFLSAGHLRRRTSNATAGNPAARNWSGSL